jgi:hypothetical protein
MPLNHCYRCGELVSIESPNCPRCQSDFGVPDCTQCGHPVASPSEDCTPFCFSTWNTEWPSRCAHCGFEYSATTRIPTGHSGSPATLSASDSTAPPFVAQHQGQSELSIAGGESIHMQYDFWDHQPTVEIHVTRQEAGNCNEERTRLQTQERIQLTVAECLEVLRQLQGSLSPLLKRQPWWRDTT